MQQKCNLYCRLRCMRFRGFLAHGFIWVSLTLRGVFDQPDTLKTLDVELKRKKNNGHILQFGTLLLLPVSRFHAQTD